MYKMKHIQINCKIKCILIVTVIIFSLLSCVILSIVQKEFKTRSMSAELKVGTIKASKQFKNMNHTDAPRTVGTGSEAVIQSERNILVLIEEIHNSDSRHRGKFRLAGYGNNSCPTEPRLINQVDDLLCTTPPRFLPEYKNPCWKSTDNKFRCMPYFQIIGMDKCGTTDLFERIANHPDVLRNSGVLQKETRWWSWKRYGHWLRNTWPVESFDRYLEYFDSAAAAIKARSDDELITGEGSPMDLWDNSGWVSIPQNAGLAEPIVVTPHLIRHVNPRVKLIIILRDPIDRLFSDYIFLRQAFRTTRRFHEEVVQSITELHGCTRKSSLRACLYDRSLNVNLNARIHLGFYSIFLQDWFNVFPREQFMILRMEDYAKHIEEHLNQVYTFLALHDLPKSEMVNIARAKRKNVTGGKQGRHMLQQTRDILKRLYNPYNRELADLLGDTRYLWKT